MINSKIYLKVSENDPDVAYLYLPGHPGEKRKNIVKSQIRLYDVIKNYKGPDIYLDIDYEDNVIGLEILG
ncbi:MAG: DUF2283 domain-containing protein [Clostridiaceae bacterium]|jgi:uncharacterized protein YuzE|nr:DUF2283 domain-containing protein [Clostridiaceae bacterium]